MRVRFWSLLDGTVSISRFARLSLCPGLQGATTVVIGPKSVAELDTAIEAEEARPLDAGEMAEIDRLVAEARS